MRYNDGKIVRDANYTFPKYQYVVLTFKQQKNSEYLYYDIGSLVSLEDDGSNIDGTPVSDFAFVRIRKLATQRREQQRQNLII